MRHGIVKKRKPNPTRPPWTALCPECACDLRVVRCHYLYRWDEQWGSVITFHYYWRCPVCRTKLVQIGDGEPEQAAS